MSKQEMLKAKAKAKEEEGDDEEDMSEAEEEAEEEKEDQERLDKEKSPEEKELDEPEGKEESEKCMTNKSDLTEDDLQKSLDRLSAIVTAEDRGSRKQDLLAKAQKSELNKSEREELFDLLGSDGAAKEDLADEITKGMRDNDTMQKALDVSDYLSEQHGELVKALGSIAEHIEQSDFRQHEFNLILANATSHIGNLVKGMSERLGIIEEQPIRAPKSRTAAPLSKSFAGTPTTEDLTKSEIMEELDRMVQDSMSKGLSGSTDEGIDLAIETSKFEQFNAINPVVLAQIKQRIANRNASH